MSRGNYAFVGMTVLVYRLHSLHVLEDFKRYQSVIRLSGHLGSARKTNKKYIFFCKCKPLLNYQANTPYFTFFCFFVFWCSFVFHISHLPRKKKKVKNIKVHLFVLFFCLDNFFSKNFSFFLFPFPLIVEYICFAWIPSSILILFHASSSFSLAYVCVYGCIIESLLII